MTSSELQNGAHIWSSSNSAVLFHFLQIAVQRALEDAIQAWRLDAILLQAYVNRMNGFSEIEKEDQVSTFPDMNTGG